MKQAKYRAAKKILRKAQRQAHAVRRQDINTALITSCQSNNRDDFYRLVKRQRAIPRKKASINFGKHKDLESDANSWANYFKDLATPKDDPSFDSEHERYLRTNYLLQALTVENNTLPLVSKNQIIKLINSLKSRKAPDIYGISSEHLKNASPIIYDIILHLINSCIKKGIIPDSFKLGSICPVPKKGKSQKLPTNYRRITITSIVGKVIELHMVNIARAILDPMQSPYQFGFSKGCSPIYAALLLTEVVAEARDNKNELIIVLMDTSKAFDVVSHTGMLNAMYTQGVSGSLWSLFNSMYTNIRSSVKWEDTISEPFAELQGIRQGGSSSADNYKAGKNNLLQLLHESSETRMGHLHLGAVMVADDLALLSSNRCDMQSSLSTAEHDAARERYKYNTDKTKVIPVNCNTEPALKLYNQQLGISCQEAHLGILRNQTGSNKETIAARIHSARKTVMSLLGAGMCGYNGSGPYIGRELYKTYVLPVLLYGLEALVLNDDEVRVLETYHRQNLRCIQHLPRSTANSAVHLLIGIPPIEALIDIRALSMLRNILIVDHPSPLTLFMRDFMVRQLAMKDNPSCSWAGRMRLLTEKYGLPSVGTLLEETPSKEEWKKLIQDVVMQSWTTKLQEDTKSKTSLSLLDTEGCCADQMHPVWADIENPLTVRKAVVKAMLLVQRYPVTTCKTAGSRMCELCPMCQCEPESMMHFILHCPNLAATRANYLPKILEHCRALQLSIDPPELLRYIIDSNHPDVRGIPDYEALTRNYIFKLHNMQSIMLGGESTYRNLKG